MSKILLIDDHSIVRAGIRDILNNISDFDTILEANDLDSAKQIILNTKLDIVVMDLMLGDNYSIELVRDLKHSQPSVKILIFSMMPKSVYGLYVLNAGANIYIEKTANEIEIKETLREWLHNPSLETKDNINIKISMENELSLLSEKEHVVFTYLIRGATLKSICNAMNLKQTTVSTYKKRIYEKLHIESVADLIKLSEKYRIY